MTKSYVCLLCYKPNDIWVKFLSTFTKYEVYIVIDDNSMDYTSQYAKFKNIHIVQVNDEDCLMNGFVNMNFMIDKEVTAWEKCIYYFSSIHTHYNKIWFFEDDVFFYDEDCLLSIDKEYPHSDLLSNEYQENKGEKGWHWDRIEIQFPNPYYSAMVCCVRFSSSLLREIKEYANTHQTLFFLEALFPTMCKKHQLKCDMPSQFKHIHYRKNFADDEIDEHHLYHPIKDIAKHTYYRDRLTKQIPKTPSMTLFQKIWN